MTNLEFSKIIEQPEHILESTTIELKTIVDEFPYFQSARALYLKGLKEQDSFKYNNALKTTAAYTSDRSVLFDFITTQEFNQNSISEFIKHNSEQLYYIDVDFEDISEKTQHDKEQFQEQLNASKSTLNPDLFEEKTTLLAETKEEIIVEEKSPEDTLQIGKPLDFKTSETHSFSEWLSLSQLKPIERTTKKEVFVKTEGDTSKKTTNPIIAKKNQLIESFISKNPKLKPKKNLEPNINLAKAQMLHPEELMTETLARIYVEQKNFKKAIQSYKILSLKYPEKSGFFAD
ncbi:hypothetical protein, partial [Aurantibacter sp.]|uniref:hypothetical protein n=1 Tax=Aurantibacter sp. TaxID=2807103 RepID=UPI0035C85592